MAEKLIIYQLFPRIFTNMNDNCRRWGTLEENGSGKMNQITPKVIKSLAGLGVNCLWLTGIIEMATKSSFPGIPADNPNVVKGEAGSPYAIKDYYDVAPSLAEVPERRMEEFTSLVERIHKEGLKVIIDFVPNHTARVYKSDSAPAGVEDFGVGDNKGKFFDNQNNYYYVVNQQFAPHFDLAVEGDVPYVEFPAKATGNDCFSAFCGRNDWYETVKLNYGIDPWNQSRNFSPTPKTWTKMLDILLFWASKGVDGFRCDMVFMVPQEFWHWAIPQVKEQYPGIIFIGEIYDINLYRSFLDYSHFDYLYDKVNLYDTLVGIERFNYSAAQLTGCWQRIDGMGDRMLNFLENHDEVRYASREYANDANTVVPALVVSSMISKGPFMIYYGQELGEPAHDNEGFAGDNNRTTIFDYWSMDKMRRWYDGGSCGLRRLSREERALRKTYARILGLCNSEAAIREGAFFDLMYANLNHEGFNPHRHFAFMRYTEKEVCLIVVNFSDSNDTIPVRMPQHAIEFAGVAEGEMTAMELLSGQEVSLLIESEKATKIEVGARNAVILKLKKD